MPRRLDLYRKLAQVTNNPLNTLSPQALSGIAGQGTPNPYSVIAGLNDGNNGITDFLNLLDQVTGLDLVSWYSEFTGLVTAIFGGLGGTGTATNSGIETLLDTLAVDASNAWTNVENFLETGDWSDLSTAWNELFEALVGGDSSTGLLGNISASSVSNIDQNVQPASDFPKAASLAAGSGWSYDGATSYGGSGGSALYTAAGVLGALRGVVSAVQPGQVVTPSAQVQWSGLSAASGTHPIQLQLIPYSGPNDALVQGAPFEVAQVTSPSSSSAWMQLTGSYTVPSSGVTAVQMRLVVTSDATVGSVWWAACTDNVSGGFLADLDTDLTDIIDSFAPGGTAAEFQTGVANLLQLFGLDSSSILSSSTAAAIWNDTITNIIDPLDLLISKVGTDWTNLIDGLENTWDSLFGSTSAPSSGSTISQEVVDGLTDVWNWLTGTTTPTSSTQVQATAVASSTGSSSLHADITTVSGTASGAASAASAAQSSADTNTSDLSNTWSWLYGTTSPTGSTDLVSTVLPDITASMSSDLSGVLNAIGNALGLGTTGNTVSSISTPLVEVLGPSAFRAYCSSGSVTWGSGASTGALAFPLTLDVTDYNTGGYTWGSSTNSLTVAQKGLYYVKIGMAVKPTLTASGYKVVAPILYQNGSVTRYGAGPPLIGNSTNPSPQCWIADSFSIECDAGDVLNPGVYYNWSTNSSAVVISGESSGAETYFEVTLVRADAS